ncbi:MAG: zinc-ribbon domain-containing protein [Clostridia bacterium]|nr:zinc-ribbon domain-containing protein [Clostridia bacterium]
MKKSTKPSYRSISFARWCEENHRIDMLTEWDASKNGLSAPENTSYGSTKKIHWKCKLGHEWEATVNNRTSQKSDCPICGNKIILPGFNDLATLYPNIASKWHKGKNQDLSPSKVAPQSNKYAWWVCSHGHEFQSKICSMVRDNINCPICENKQVLIGYNDLATTHPALAKEWNHLRNKELTPTQVTYGSHKKVWWVCPQNHEWQATVASRAFNKTNCPYCTKQKVLVGINDLATVNPKLAEEWNYELNTPVTPSNIFPNSNQNYWWHCPAGHSYKASAASRTRGRGCPYCTGRKVLIGFNDLQSINPSLAAEWHPSLNLPLTPRDITAGSDKKVWWICNHNHIWEATISSRNRGNGCPECAKGTQTSLPEKVICFYLKKHFPDTLPNVRFPWLEKMEVDIFIPSLNVAVEYDGDFWHQDVKKDLLKDRLCHEHNIHLIRIREPNCPLYDHIYSHHIITKATQANVNYLEETLFLLFAYLNQNFKTNIYTSFNPVADYSLILQDAITFEQQDSIPYTHPRLLAEWNHEKNGSLLPHMFPSGSQKKVWWKCNENHEWQASISSRVRGANCPYCAGRYVLAGYNDFETVHPELLSEWDYDKNAPLLPSQILNSSNKKIWWRCKEKHSWKTSISVRLRGNNCPYCSNQKILVGYNDLATSHPALIKEWDYEKNTTLFPTEVCAGTEKKVWWICPEGHSYSANIRTRAKLNTGCRICYQNSKKKA